MQRKARREWVKSRGREGRKQEEAKRSGRQKLLGVQTQASTIQPLRIVQFTCCCCCWPVNVFDAEVNAMLKLAYVFPYTTMN